MDYVARTETGCALRDAVHTVPLLPRCEAVKAALPARGWSSLDNAEGRRTHALVGITCTGQVTGGSVVWVTGPIYDNRNPNPFAPGRKVQKPKAFYKVVVSPGGDVSVDVPAFIVPREAIPKSADLSKFLVSVDEVERRRVSVSCATCRIPSRPCLRASCGRCGPISSLPSGGTCWARIPRPETHSRKE